MVPVNFLCFCLRKAKERWMKTRCGEIKELMHKHEHWAIHKKVEEDNVTER